MKLAIKHRKRSVSQDNPGREINPSDWNDDHSVDGLVGAFLALPATPNSLPMVDQNGNGALQSLSSVVRSMLAATSSSDLRTAIGITLALLGGVAKTGDSMSGNLAMATNKVTGLGAPSDPTDAVTKAYADALVVGGSGGFAFKGAWDASAGTFPGAGAAQPGWFYLVTVAGTVNGVAFDIGDSLYAVAANASASIFAANWARVEGNITIAEIQAILGFTFGSLAAQSSVTASQISDATANGRSLIQATNYAAMLTLLGIVAGTSVGNFVAVQAGGKLPALDGSLLTNLPSSSVSAGVMVAPTEIITASGTVTIKGATAVVKMSAGASMVMGGNAIVKKLTGLTVGATLAAVLGAGGTSNGAGGDSTLSSGTQTITQIKTKGGSGNGTAVTGDANFDRLFKGRLRPARSNSCAPDSLYAGIGGLGLSNSADDQYGTAEAGYLEIQWFA